MQEKKGRKKKSACFSELDVLGFRQADCKEKNFKLSKSLWLSAFENGSRMLWGYMWSIQKRITRYPTESVLNTNSTQTISDCKLIHLHIIYNLFLCLPRNAAIQFHRPKTLLSRQEAWIWGTPTQMPFPLDKYVTREIHIKHYYIIFLSNSNSKPDVIPRSSIRKYWECI